MEKINLLPGINVYKGLFNNVENILNIIKNSEGDIKDQHEPAGKGFIRDWVKWYDFGIMTNFAPDLVGKKLMYSEEDDLKKQTIFEQIKTKQEIVNVIDFVFNDYMSEWKNVVEWPNYVKNFGLSKEYTSYIEPDNSKRNLTLQQIDALKHNIYPDKDFAINFHSDSPRYHEDEPGFKQMLSLTIYLNDDYEGGEIQFLNDKENKLVTYKPKAGDMTIFPSFHPFWHAAKPVVSGSNKYLLRVFISWYYDGSKEWIHGRDTYGLAKWESMQENRENDEVNNGSNERMVLIDGQEPYDYPAVKVYIESSNIIYIDGRLI